MLTSESPSHHSPGLCARQPAPVLISRVPFPALPPVLLVLAVAPIGGREAEVGVRGQVLGAAVHLGNRQEVGTEWLCCWGGVLLVGQAPMHHPAGVLEDGFKHLAKAMGAGGELADLHGGFLVIGFFVLRIQVAVPLGAS